MLLFRQIDYFRVSEWISVTIFHLKLLKDS